MAEFLITPEVQDPDVRGRAVRHARERGIRLPTFRQMANPAEMPEDVRSDLKRVPSDEAHPLNLFRIHWFNGRDNGQVLESPAWVEVPSVLSGVDARIVVVLGDAFPMIGAHKVLAAYACLVLPSGDRTI